MAALDLSSLKSLFEKGKSFELTEQQYEEQIKRALPQTEYFERRSPVAREAKKYGYKIQVEERIHRVVIFKKMEKTGK